MFHILAAIVIAAVNPPHWDHFAGGVLVDTANLTNTTGIAAAYVKIDSQPPRLYEVDCDGNRIRLHSDQPRYVQVPMGSGISVIQSDDGFRTVSPESREARIENAICERVHQSEIEEIRQRQATECERAKHDDLRRILFVREQLSEDESMCLLSLSRGDRPMECDKAEVPKDISVREYLQKKGLTLECEKQDH